LKIKTTKDIVIASNTVIGNIVSQAKITVFNLLVDHEEGTISNCMWTPTTKLADGKSFLAVDDYAKIMLLLMTHPRVKDLEYNEKENMISAVFSAPEMQEVDRIERPDEDYS